MVTRRGLRLTAALAAVGATLTLVAPAQAATDPLDEGLWYYSRTHLPWAHEQATGEGITIAVLDGVVNPDVPDLRDANVVVPESSCRLEDGTPVATATDASALHGTSVLALLAGTGVGVDGRRGVQGVAPGARVLSYNVLPPGFDEDVVDPETGKKHCFFEGGSLDNGQVFAESIDRAVAEGADIITISVGYGWTPGQIGAAVERAYAAGVVIVGAVSNTPAWAGDPQLGYPADGNGVVAVEMADVDRRLVEPTTESPRLTVVAPGVDVRMPTFADDGVWDEYTLVTGTSLAAPWVAGVLAVAWSAHPEATGNQMIQALIRTTGSEGPELSHDPRWGYGPVSVRDLMAVDPTRYPDVNPLLRPLDDQDAIPSTAAILEATGQEPAPEATADPEPTATPTEGATPPTDAPADEPAADGSGPSLPVLVAGGAGVLLLAAGAWLVLRRRDRSTTATREDG